MTENATTAWAQDAVFYHIYPLGLCGAPRQNDFSSADVHRLDKLHGWLDHLVELGVTAVYLGPLFESSSHGYDTADYYRVDRRLGNNGTLAKLTWALHERGIRVVLDGVFNHTGRQFWAFQDLLSRGEESPYREWFAGVDFGRRSPQNDPFSYEAWEGHSSLVKLNLHNQQLRDHLFGAVEKWINDFGIDGLRLDVAYCIDRDFLRALAAHCRRLKPDFWLMGEMIHGDYRNLLEDGQLDSVTNYESYKALYSSHVDRNYFELAYALNRQFGEGGLYREKSLYNFADNHDVDRVASRLTAAAQLYPLYALLFTMPGIPSVYYGSEWGIDGKRSQWEDHGLRPCLDLDSVRQSGPNRDLVQTVRRLAELRKAHPALRNGAYRQLHVNHEQLAFSRESEEERLVVAVNSAENPSALELQLPFMQEGALVDVLNDGERFSVRGGRVKLDPLHPRWARVLRPE